MGRLSSRRPTTPVRRVVVHYSAESEPAAHSSVRNGTVQRFLAAFVQLLSTLSTIALQRAPSYSCLQMCSDPRRTCVTSETSWLKDAPNTEKTPNNISAWIWCFLINIHICLCLKGSCYEGSSRSQIFDSCNLIEQSHLEFLRISWRVWRVCCLYIEREADWKWKSQARINDRGWDLKACGK